MLTIGIQFLFSDAFDVQQVIDGSEWTMCFPVGYNPFSQ